MTTTLTDNQVQWAAQHDWFVRDNHDGTITVREVWTKGGQYGEELKQFGNFRALYLWAGY